MSPWDIIGWIIVFFIGTSLVASLGGGLFWLWIALTDKIDEQRKTIKKIEDADR